MKHRILLSALALLVLVGLLLVIFDPPGPGVTTPQGEGRNEGPPEQVVTDEVPNLGAGRTQVSSRIALRSTRGAELSASTLLFLSEDGEIHNPARRSGGLYEVPVQGTGVLVAEAPGHVLHCGPIQLDAAEPTVVELHPSGTLSVGLQDRTGKAVSVPMDPVFTQDPGAFPQGVRSLVQSLVLAAQRGSPEAGQDLQDMAQALIRAGQAAPEHNLGLLLAASERRPGQENPRTYSALPEDLPIHLVVQSRIRPAATPELGFARTGEGPKAPWRTRPFSLEEVGNQVVVVLESGFISGILGSMVDRDGWEGEFRVTTLTVVTGERDRFMVWNPEDSGPLAPDGSFFASPLSAGTKQVALRWRSGLDLGLCHGLVELEEGEDRDLGVVTPEDSLLLARVRSEGAPAGIRSARVRVKSQNTRQSLERHGDVTVHLPVPLDDTFRIHGLPAGAYTIGVAGVQGDDLPRLDSEAIKIRIQLPTAEVVELPLSFRPAGFKVSIEAVLPGDTRVRSSCSIELVDAQGGTRGLGRMGLTRNAAGEWVHKTLSQELSGGPYVAWALSTAGPTGRYSRQPIEITASGQVHRMVLDQEGGLVRGIIPEPFMENVRFLSAKVTVEGGVTLSTEAVLEPTGAFEIKGLPPGSLVELVPIPGSATATVRVSSAPGSTTVVPADSWKR